MLHACRSVLARIRRRVASAAQRTGSCREASACAPQGSTERHHVVAPSACPAPGPRSPSPPVDGLPRPSSSCPMPGRIGGACGLRSRLASTAPRPPLEQAPPLNVTVDASHGSRLAGQRAISPCNPSSRRSAAHEGVVCAVDRERALAMQNMRCRSVQPEQTRSASRRWIGALQVCACRLTAGAAAFSPCQRARCELGRRRRRCLGWAAGTLRQVSACLRSDSPIWDRSTRSCTHECRLHRA